MIKGEACKQRQIATLFHNALKTCFDSEGTQPRLQPVLKFTLPHKKRPNFRCVLIKVLASGEDKEKDQAQPYTLEMLEMLVYGTRCVSSHGSATRTLAPNGAIGGIANFEYGVHLSEARESTKEDCEEVVKTLTEWCQANQDGTEQ